MKLNDQSPMPVGDHQGKAMDEVPANYLLFIRDQDWMAKTRNPKWVAVRQYIDENLQVLKKEQSEMKWSGSK